MLRDQIKEAQKDAMKAKDAERLGVVRLILSAIKDKDIANRVGEPSALDDDKMVSELLSKMVKQRRDSIKAYEDGNRPDLAAKEQAEIAIIETFMPAQMSDAEVEAAIKAIVTETGAQGPKDMGKVMAELKARFAGQMDFGKASPMVKAALS